MVSTARGVGIPRRSGRPTGADSLPQLSRPEQILIAGAILWLLVGPRIAVPGGSGVRYEDLTFVLLVVLITLTRARRSLMRRQLVPIGILTAASLVSSVVATLESRVAPTTALLYSLRPLEYWVVFPAVLMLVQPARKRWRTQLRWLLAAVTVLQTGFALAQYVFNIDIGFSHQAYSRGAGLTAGPYELGAISATLFIYWLVQRRWLLALVAIAGLTVSISRISVIGVIVAVGALAAHRFVQWAIAWRGRRRDPGNQRGTRRARSTVLVGVAALALVLIGGAAGIFFASPQGQELDRQTVAPIATRFTSTSILGSWDAASGLASRLAPIHTAAEYNSIAYDHIFDHVDAKNANEVGAEPSNLVRFFRWHLILDNMDFPEAVAVGLGPSFVGGSVDGSYLRFFADGGLLGVIAWVSLIISWFRRVPPWMIAVTITMLVGATFIDILYALRPMVLFWVLLALARSSPELERSSALGGIRRIAASLRRPGLRKNVEVNAADAGV